MSEPKGRTYALTYDIRAEKEPLAAERVEELKRGGCDSMLFVSVLHLDGQEDMLDGATSSLVMGINGYTGRGLTALEVFQIWTSIAERLECQLPEDTPARQLCEDVNDAVKEMFDGPVYTSKGKPN